MKPVRSGIIGCGVISESHLRLAAKCPLTSVVAVADVMEDWVKARAEQFRIPAFYSNYKSVKTGRSVSMRGM